MKQGYVYVMSNRRRTVLYIGVTSNLAGRVQEHKEGHSPGFAAKYRCVDLVYYEVLDGMYEAIAREKQLKKWHREWKLRLIRSVNPEMKDLSGELF